MTGTTETWKTLLKRSLMVVFSASLFLLVWALYTPHQGAWRTAPEWGNAPTAVRTAVLQQLAAFQDGYSQRDTDLLDSFMERLFSRQRPLIIGTMPGEIYPGYEAAAEVIKTDWESWGDCTFRLNETQVSAQGNVAWFATVGSVRFDLSRFLLLPLRLSGVMVNEGGTWKIRQLQFQFDLDLSSLLLADIVLLVWVTINIILLAAAIWRRLRAVGAS